MFPKVTGMLLEGGMIGGVKGTAFFPWKNPVEGGRNKVQGEVSRSE